MVTAVHAGFVSDSVVVVSLSKRSERLQAATDDVRHGVVTVGSPDDAILVAILAQVVLGSITFVGIAVIRHYGTTVSSIAV